MTESVIRNFKVQGTIKGLFTPDVGSPQTIYRANMVVELWYKGPVEVVFLGKGLTTVDGSFSVEFELESPSPMIVNGQITNVFLKVVYNGKVVTGDIDPSAGSFD